MRGLRRKRAACARTAAQAQDRAAHAEGRPPKALLPIERGRLAPVRPPWGPLRVTARRVRGSDAREVAPPHRSDASPRTSPTMTAAPPRGALGMPRCAERCHAMPRDAERAQGAMPPRCRRMPRASTSFHEPLDLAYLPSMVSHLEFRVCFSYKFRSILPSLPDDETLKSRSFREFSRVLAFT